MSRMMRSDLLEAGQLHLALQRLPMLAAEPFCLAVLLRCFQESLRRSRCSENELQVLGVGHGNQWRIWTIYTYKSKETCSEYYRIAAFLQQQAVHTHTYNHNEREIYIFISLQQNGLVKVRYFGSGLELGIAMFPSSGATFSCLSSGTTLHCVLNIQFLNLYSIDKPCFWT